MKQVSWNEERGPIAEGRKPIVTPDRTFNPSVSPSRETSPSNPMATPYLVAEGLMGTRERLSNGSLNPLIEVFHDTTTMQDGDADDSWCSSFMNYCHKSCGIRGTDSPAARSWSKWGTPVSSNELVKGDIVVLTRGDPMGWQGHVGFFHSRIDGVITLLGGNQKNMVRLSQYPMSRYLAGRRRVTDVTE